MESMKKKNSGSNRECSVCGDEAAYCFYGAIVCDSCRAFFRRSVIRAKQQVTCRRLKKRKSQNNSNDGSNNEQQQQPGGQCDVSVANRKFCSKCRMDKCILVGMKKEHVFILKGNSNSLNSCNSSNSNCLHPPSPSYSKSRSHSHSQSSSATSVTSSSTCPSPLSPSSSSNIDQEREDVDEDTGDKRDCFTRGKIHKNDPQLQTREGKASTSTVAPVDVDVDNVKGQPVSSSSFSTSFAPGHEMNNNCSTEIHFQAHKFNSQTEAGSHRASCSGWQEAIECRSSAQPKCNNIGVDLSLSVYDAGFTSEEVHKLQLFSYMADYCRQRPVQYPKQLSDTETIFYISQIFTERLVYILGEMTLFPVLPLNIQSEICQLFVPLSFIIKSFVTLRENGNLNQLGSLKSFGNLSILPPEIYIPVKVSIQSSNALEYEKIINFLQRYADVMQSTPKCFFKDFRMILVTYTYLLYEYLNEIERDQRLGELPQLRHSICSHSASVTELFRKLATAQYGGEMYKQMLKVLPDLTHLTQLFGSLTLAPASVKTAIGP